MAETDYGYVIKDKNGYYFTGYDKWDIQLRKAKIYHSYNWAQEIQMKKCYLDREPYIVKVKIEEV